MLPLIHPNMILRAARPTGINPPALAVLILCHGDLLVHGGDVHMCLSLYVVMYLHKAFLPLATLD